MEMCSKILIEEFKQKEFKRTDLFICSSSFEERSVNISSNINQDQIKNVAICHFENTYEASNLNLKKLQIIFSKQSPQTILLKKHDPLKNYDILFELINKLPHNPRIIVDITTFTRENLLILLRIISLVKDKSSVLFYYTPLKKYSSDDETNESWISRGVKDIRSIFGFPGEFSPIKDYLLVILTGFEYERTQTLIDNYEPSKVLLGKAYSINSINNDLANINDENFKKLMIRNPSCEAFDFSCIDIAFTKNKICEIYDKYKDFYNIVIAPMNNKLSTFAVGVAAIENPKLQICYASTNQYNINSNSLSTDYVYEINLD